MMSHSFALRFVVLAQIVGTLTSAFAAGDLESRLSDGNRRYQSVLNALDIKYARGGGDPADETPASYFKRYPDLAVTRIHARGESDSAPGKLALMVSSDPLLGAPIIQGFRDWSQASSSPNPTSLNLSRFKAKKAWDISALVPSSIASLIDRYTQSRVNCWNIASFSSGLTRGIYGMKPLEFNHLMKSPLVRKLGASDATMPGDLVVFRTVNTADVDKVDPKNESHAAVYISERMMLSKNGAKEERVTKLADSRLVFTTYVLPEANSGLSPIAVDTYRVVKTFEGFVEEQRSSLSQGLLDALVILAELETITKFVNADADNFDQDNASDEEMDRFQEQVREQRKLMYQKARQLKDLSNPVLLQNPDFTWQSPEVGIWQLIDARLGGMLVSL